MRLDRTGHRYGRLVVIGYAHNRGRLAYWRCQCDCGGRKTVQGGNLTSGNVQSCGCLNRERLSTHGESRSTVEYRIWVGMRQRCRDPKMRSYPRYGGRGITVCERWNSYETFLADMGRRPSPRHSIGRKNNDGPYAPSNCRWETLEEQHANRSDSVKITAFGETLTISDMAKRHGVPRSRLYKRIEAGLPPEEAILAPSRRGYLRRRAFKEE